MNNKQFLENSGAFSPANSPAIPLDADLAVRREAPGGLAECDKSREERIAAEILVDAYNEEEQLMGWYCYLENKLHFPFKAKWLTRGSTSEDEEVEVLEMSPENDCQEEMLVEVLYKEGKLEDVFSVPLSHIEVVEVDDVTQEAIADWLYWVDRGYQL